MRREMTGPSSAAKSGRHAQGSKDLTQRMVWNGEALLEKQIEVGYQQRRPPRNQEGRRQQAYQRSRMAAQDAPGFRYTIA